MKFKPFQFDKKDVERLMKSELNILHKEKKSFDYVFNKLKELGHYLSGDDIVFPDKYDDKEIWKETKNYDWVAVENGNVQFIIRKYGLHYTIFQCLISEHSMEWEGKKSVWTEKKYGAFYFQTDTDFVTEEEPDLMNDPSFKDYKYPSDFFCDGNDYYDINKYIHLLIDHTRERMESMWIVKGVDGEYPPKRIKVQDVFDGESITSIDKLIFCCEELSQIELELFSENEMLEKIKTLKVGDKFHDSFERNPHKIKEIRTEVKDDYYHAVGIKTTKKFYDVYHLTYWNFDAIFPDNS